MDFLYQSLGKHLFDHAGTATDEILLVAPYIKHDVLERILEPVSQGCEVRVVTRWKPREIVLGVSDLEVWELVRDHDGRSLELHSALHAKYYRFDAVSLAGSANLTGSALGWHKRPNLEFLQRFESTIAEEFESVLEGVEVTESMYRHYQHLLEEYEEMYPDIAPDIAPTTVERISKDYEEERVGEAQITETKSWWVPTLRHPGDLYRVYAGDPDRVTSATWRHGQEDLAYFDLPEGLSKEEFDMEVSWQLLQKPVVQEIDEFVETSRRFGAVRNQLRTFPCAKNDDFDATGAWQALMRWLLYFLGDRYRRYEANYSEIFVRDD